MERNQDTNMLLELLDTLYRKLGRYKLLLQSRGRMIQEDVLSCLSEKNSVRMEKFMQRFMVHEQMAEYFNSYASQISTEFPDEDAFNMMNSFAKQIETLAPELESMYRTLKYEPVRVQDYVNRALNGEFIFFNELLI